MKTRNKWIAISLFYGIALFFRYYLTVYQPEHSLLNRQSLVYLVLTGCGPFIGGIFCIYFLNRKSCYTFFGDSIKNSKISLLLPVFLFLVYDLIGGNGGFVTTKVVITCLAYAYFEEYGWRGYLQSELIHLHPLYRIGIITVAWFVWHLDFSLSMENLIFFLLLLFGSWGIGKIAISTRSLAMCTCFHALFNIISNLKLTLPVLTMLGICVATWIFLWYYRDPVSE